MFLNSNGSSVSHGSQNIPEAKSSTAHCVTLCEGAGPNSCCCANVPLIVFSSSPESPKDEDVFAASLLSDPNEFIKVETCTSGCSCENGKSSESDFACILKLSHRTAFVVDEINKRFLPGFENVLEFKTLLAGELFEVA